MEAGKVPVNIIVGIHMFPGVQTCKKPATRIDQGFMSGSCYAKACQRDINKLLFVSMESYLI